MKKNRWVVILAVLALSLWRLTSRTNAIEVALEDNKYEKGSIGYVDMHALFKLYPETEKAKLGFEDAMHQAEEQINLQRAEIIGLRAEISRLQAEKDFILKTSSVPIANTHPSQEMDILLSTAPSHNVPSMVGASSFTAITMTMPPNIPGAPAMSLAHSNTPSTSGTAPSRVSAGSLARIEEIDRTIAEKTRLLESREADFKTYETQAEKSLLDLESRKTEILLGRIYGAIQEVAKNEGVSVVVDKSQILFGHKGVDLTEKVLQKLKSQ